MKELLNNLYENLKNKEKELKEREEKIYVDFITDVEKTCERLTKKYQEYKEILVGKQNYISFYIGIDKVKTFCQKDNNGFFQVGLCYIDLGEYKKISLKNWKESNNKTSIKKAIHNIGELNWCPIVEEQIEMEIIDTLKFKVDKLVEKENELEELEKKLRKGLE